MRKRIGIFLSRTALTLPLVTGVLLEMAADLFGIQINKIANAIDPLKNRKNADLIAWVNEVVGLSRSVWRERTDIKQILARNFPDRVYLKLLESAAKNVRKPWQIAKNFDANIDRRIEVLVRQVIDSENRTPFSCWLYFILNKNLATVISWLAVKVCNGLLTLALLLNIMGSPLMGRF